MAAEGGEMTRQLARKCTRCNGLMVIKLLDSGRNAALQAVNGFCPRCRHRLAWIVIRGHRRSHHAEKVVEQH
jgi:uncharacterized paraquat-inducible protein A